MDLRTASWDKICTYRYALMFTSLLLLTIASYALFSRQASLINGVGKWNYPKDVKAFRPQYGGLTIANQPTWSRKGSNSSSISVNTNISIIITANGDRKVTTMSSTNQKEVVMSRPSNNAKSKGSGAEKRQVVLVKVHKAASSTMQSILLRFAIARNLSVLFTRGLHINESGTHIPEKGLIKHPPGEKFDILCNHLIYNRSEIAPYFPVSTVYIGIVREPFEQFKSAFIYYSQVWKYKYIVNITHMFPDDPIHGFLQNPWDPKFDLPTPNHNQINNRMSVDFGFPMSNFEEDKKDPKKIQEFVTKVHTEIDLVLISELFDESLILLRRFMNWSFKDILYFKSNVFKKKEKSEDSQWINKDNYTQGDLDMFRKWAAIDYALYETSLEIFHKKISMEDRFQSEVEAYQTVRATVSDFCDDVKNSKNNSMYLILGKNEWTDSFNISKGECEIMKMNEIVICDLAKKVQIARNVINNSKEHTNK